MKKRFRFFYKNRKKPFDILINNSAFTTEMAASKSSKGYFFDRDF